VLYCSRRYRRRREHSIDTQRSRLKQILFRSRPKRRPYADVRLKDRPTKWIRENDNEKKKTSRTNGHFCYRANLGAPHERTRSGVTNSKNYQRRVIFCRLTHPPPQKTEKRPHCHATAYTSRRIFRIHDTRWTVTNVRDESGVFRSVSTQIVVVRLRLSRLTRAPFPNRCPVKHARRRHNTARNPYGQLCGPLAVDFADV
jgi:hypothetical protein